MTSNFDFESFCYGAASVSFVVIAYVIYIFTKYEMVLYPNFKQFD